MSKAPAYRKMDQAERDRIIAAVNLQDVIGRSVKLKRENQNIMSGLSPFSAERTPSFKVWRDHYHCFSTNEHGRLFDWLTGYQGLSFPDAVREARILAGFEAGEISKARRDEIDRTARKRDEEDEAYRLRMVSYARDLVAASRPVAGTPVEFYLRERGLDPDLLGGWPAELGYHPRIKNRSGEYFRAMTHPVRTRGEMGRRGAVAGVHVTFLQQTSDGRWGKAAGTFAATGKKHAAKQMFGQCFGGAAQLWGDLSDASFPHKRRLNIGEGLESVMAARQLDIEAGRLTVEDAYWAGLSLGNVVGAQAKDKFGKAEFVRPRRASRSPLTVLASSFQEAGLPRGTPVPDTARPGFLPPKGWEGVVRIIAEDDLKDCRRTGISGRQRAQEAFRLGAAKFQASGQARQVVIAWPPAKADANDALVLQNAGREAAVFSLTEADREVLSL